MNKKIKTVLKKAVVYGIVAGMGATGGMYTGYIISNQVYRARFKYYSERTEKEFGRIKNRMEMIENSMNKVNERIDSLSSKTEELDIQFRREKMRDQHENRYVVHGGKKPQKSKPVISKKEREYKKALQEWKNKSFLARIFSHKPKPEEYGLK